MEQAHASRLVSHSRVTPPSGNGSRHGAPVALRTDGESAETGRCGAELGERAGGLSLRAGVETARVDARPAQKGVCIGAAVVAHGHAKAEGAATLSFSLHQADLLVAWNGAGLAPGAQGSCLGASGENVGGELLHVEQGHPQEGGHDLFGDAGGAVLTGAGGAGHNAGRASPPGDDLEAVAGVAERR